ncbi:MAG: class I SAM-dependent methyltransferase [Lachnospiraceae bacterium]|nr:class I SAM-dependent methyltransferase [Lachnospiraceae bacterium]
MNENIFNGLADIYDKYRPTYPKELFSYLSSKIGINESSNVADIGSGTGIFTKKLLDICGQVYAVEPNNDMRQVAELNLAHTNNFISINATAEDTTLHDQCIDFVTVAQAFHWFNREAFKKECQRILKPNGQVILIWNCRDEEDKMVQEIDLISKKYCSDFSGSSKGMRGAKNNAEYQNFFNGNYDTKSFFNPITFNKESFLGLHQSASYCPNRNEGNYKKYMEDLSYYFESHCQNGILVLQNNTCCYIGHI